MVYLFRQRGVYGKSAQSHGADSLSIRARHGDFKNRLKTGQFSLKICVIAFILIFYFMPKKCAIMSHLTRERELKRAIVIL
jgi:hypothetical protein